MITEHDIATLVVALHQTDAVPGGVVLDINLKEGGSKIEIKVGVTTDAHQLSFTYGFKNGPGVDQRTFVAFVAGFVQGLRGMQIAVERMERGETEDNEPMVPGDRVH